MKEYKIPFLGLKMGKHHFRYTLTETFFGSFDYTEIHQGSLEVSLELEKRETMLLLDFDIHGTVKVHCDRCGDEIDQPIGARQNLVVKLGDKTGSTDEEWLMLGPNEHELDVSQYLYEYSHLALPVKHAHATLAECNQAVVSELKKYMVENDSDSKWEELKNLEHNQDNINEEDE